MLLFALVMIVSAVFDRVVTQCAHEILLNGVANIALNIGDKLYPLTGKGVALIGTYASTDDDVDPSAFEKIRQRRTGFAANSDKLICDYLSAFNIKKRKFFSLAEMPEYLPGKEGNCNSHGVSSFPSSIKFGIKEQL